MCIWSECTHFVFRVGILSENDVLFFLSFKRFLSKKGEMYNCNLCVFRVYLLTYKQMPFPSVSMIFLVGIKSDFHRNDVYSIVTLSPKSHFV